jgi:hypothetical protein
MNTENATSTEIVFNPRALTPAQFAELGVSQLAYIKPVTVEGKQVFSIHAANGVPMGLAEDSDTAAVAIIQHEMVPARVH